MVRKRNCSEDNQSNKIGTTDEFADLPEELIHNILVRLPVKSLLKFRCVSKSWLSLISTPQFVKTHFEISSRYENLTNHGIVFTSNFDLKLCPVSSFMSESFIVAPNVDYPNKSRDGGYLNVVGCCNGVICIQTGINDVFLWNPSTRKSKALPIEAEMIKCCHYMWGFSFIEAEDDYKVVCIFGKYRRRYKCTVKIYSLRTDTWKRISDFKFGLPYASTGTLACGKLHFVTKSGYKWNVVSLDLTTEAYDILKQPNHVKGWSDPHLGTHGGCLSICYLYERTTRADLWVMKEYGVKESWTRLVLVPCFTDDDTDTEAFLHFEPLLVMPNGEILFSSERYIVVYNPKDNCFKYSHIIGFNHYDSAHIYVESLVPI